MEVLVTIEFDKDHVAPPRIFLRLPEPHVIWGPKCTINDIAAAKHKALLWAQAEMEKPEAERATHEEEVSPSAFEIQAKPPRQVTPKETSVEGAAHGPKALVGDEEFELVMPTSGPKVTVKVKKVKLKI